MEHIYPVSGDSAIAPVPRALQRSALALIDTVDRAIIDASYAYAGDGGDYTLYTGEDISVFEASPTPPDPALSPTKPMDLHRSSYAENDFVLTTQVNGKPDESHISLSADGRLVGDHVKELLRQSSEIMAGVRVGIHAVSGVRILRPEGLIYPLTADVSRAIISDGTGTEARTYDLGLMRFFLGKSVVMQSVRIVYNPGDVGDRIMQASIRREIKLWDGETDAHIDDPQPALTAAMVQATYNPPVGVDRPPTFPQWAELIRDPISTRNLLA